MTLEPPAPPTAPAPAIRPKPPTPPRIDKTPFVKEKSADTPENMARDAVANGSGALTKRTVDKGNDENPPANQTVTVIPPDAPIIADEQSDYDRGQDVLRQFREEDNRVVQPKEKFSAKTETPETFTPTINHQTEHGGAYWIFTIIFAAVAAFIIVKKFLLTDKPALTKSQIFEDDKVKPVVQRSAEKINATTDKIKPVAPPPKPARVSPKKSDDDKGKHFEIRV